MSAGADAPLLSVRDLHKTFVLGNRRVAVLNGVGFDLSAGSTLALVGESGSGKTTTARLILRLAAADRGSVQFDGMDWLLLPRRELDRRRREVGVVFQDPATSLDPRLTIGEIVAEPLAIHGIGGRASRLEKAADLVASVGLPISALTRYPRELSGGQRQRVAIARALATGPRLVVLDEPVSALDVSVRSQILNVLRSLQKDTPSRPAYLFVGHDLSVVRWIADRTAVMYMGRIVEEAATEALFSSPRHPYTALLLASRPREMPGPRTAPRPDPGELPSPAAPPPGCPFHPRCASVRPVCLQEVPALVAEGERSVACHAPLRGV
ncbi:MAG: ABC transporter ATP-binding protein [Acidobacteriota bacterium]